MQSTKYSTFRRIAQVMREKFLRKTERERHKSACVKTHSSQCKGRQADRARARASKTRHCRVEACRGRIVKLVGSLSSCQVHYVLRRECVAAAAAAASSSLEGNAIPLRERKRQ